LDFTTSLDASASPSAFVSPLLSLAGKLLEFEPSDTAVLFLDYAVAYDEAVSFGLIEAPVKTGTPPFSLSFFSLSIISLIYFSLSSYFSCFNLSASSSYA
jgi:hypothetical protein